MHPSVVLPTTPAAIDKNEAQLLLSCNIRPIEYGKTTPIRHRRVIGMEIEFSVKNITQGMLNVPLPSSLVYF